MTAADPEPTTPLDAILQKVAKFGRIGPPNGEGPAAVASSLLEVTRAIEQVSELYADASARLAKHRSVAKIKRGMLRIAMDESMRDDPAIKFARNQQTRESRARAKHADLFRELDALDGVVGDFAAVTQACKATLASLESARSTMQTRARLYTSQNGRF